MGGCHSRSYDYLHGLGGLDWHLWIHGWLESQSAGSAERREPWTEEWSPPPSLVEMARRQFPRWVRQHWGILPAESRSQMLYRDIALSCCGAGYGAQDSTLVVDLPGGRELPRCYFIRRRPRGSLWKEENRNGFRPASQGPAHAAVLGRGTTVVRCLGAGDLSRPGPGGCGSLSCPEPFRAPPPDANLARRQAAGDARGDGGQAGRSADSGSDSLVLRYGSAAVGVCVPWCMCARIGVRSTRNLVDDGNPWNCLRLTVDHGRRADFENAAAERGGARGHALWVRVGSHLTRDADFDAWRKEFETATLRLTECSEQRFQVEVPGKEGPLLDHRRLRRGTSRAGCNSSRNRIKACWKSMARNSAVRLLAAVEPLCSLPPGTGPLGCMTVPAGKAFFWEAESGLVLPGMAVGEDAAASGGRYVGQESSPIGQPSGIVMWSLAIEKPGRYWLWARVRSAMRGTPVGHGAFSVPGDW